MLPELKQFIVKETQEGALFNEARRFGAVSIKEDGAAKVLQGYTTVDELLRAAY